ESGIVLPLFHEVDYRVAGPKVRGLQLSNAPPYINYTEIGKSEASGRPVLRKMEGGSIHIPILGGVQSLDPTLLATTAGIEMLSNVFECLTRETEEARIVPWLASEFHAEPGSRRFRFRLRDDVRFHDGRRLSARDVRYSFEHLLMNPTSPNRSLVSS